MDWQVTRGYQNRKGQLPVLFSYYNDDPAEHPDFPVALDDQKIIIGIIPA